MRLLLAAFLISLTIQLTAQTDRCHQEQWLEEIEESQPGYTDQIYNSLKNHKKLLLEQDRSNAFVVIPVHVILVHSPGESEGSGTNFSLAHVQSQIDVINADFGRYNADAGNTPGVFPAADTGIQFCLATVDPDGNPTDGVTRYGTNTSMANGSGRTQVISETRWPRESYMNIWSAPNLPFLGLASVPGTGGLPSPNNDFVLVDSGTFGGPGFGTTNGYDLGRTTTHEIGHWLGLLHVWGNGGCGSDDGIGDTPNQTGENFGCPNHPSPTCSNGGDMFMNYMDYVNDNCMNAFTVEQGSYMNTILSTSRASLQGSAGTACTTAIPLSLAIIDQQDPTCADNADGLILAEASGGNEPYSYTINSMSPNSTGIFTDLVGGTYIIDVFDNNGNNVSQTITLQSPELLVGLAAITQTNPCPNEEAGIVEIITTGGTLPYFYSINNGSSQSSNVFDGLVNGFYAYQVTDVNGCTYADVFELEGGESFTLVVESISDESCSGLNDGQINAEIEESVTVDYSIDGINYQAVGSFADLSGGEYTIYAQDVNGCLDSVSATVESAPLFSIEVTASELSCNGAADGSISIDTSTSANGPLTLSLNGETIETDVVNNLAAGSYDILISNAMDCDTTISIVLTEPSAIEIDNTETTNAECSGTTLGSILIAASGGTGTITYTLGQEENSTGLFTALEAGLYTIIVTDDNDCAIDATVLIASESDLTITTVIVFDASCQGLQDGSIEIDFDGAVGTPVFRIDGGANQTSPLFDGLGAGDYIITVEDESGCTDAITMTISEPDQISLAAEVLSSASCFGASDGVITYTATGGTAPYFYEVSPNADLNNLAAGTYLITATDNNGCAISEEIVITQPEPVMPIFVSVQGANCNSNTGGSVSLGATGGSESGYMYTLTGPNGSDTKTIGLFNELSYGNYMVTITDNTGCQGSADLIIPYENNFFANILSIDDIDCFGENGGGVNLEINGGLGDITYLLDNTVEVDPTNLETNAGDHTINIYDENGCMIELPFSLLEPTALTLDYTLEDFDLLTLLADGGTPPYMYNFGSGYSDENTTNLIATADIDVSIIDANGCEVMTTILISSVSEPSLNWTAAIAPNPISDVANVLLNLKDTQEISIQIFDTNGRLLTNIPSNKYKSGENFVKIDATDFVSSLYIVKIATAEGYRIIKMTKM